jgi:GH18 family chitinase
MNKIFLTFIFCKNIITIFLITASVIYSQTTITKVIDPGGKGDFTSLQSWASWVSSSTSGNLVTANVVEVARCICTNGQPDTEPLNSYVLTITTDASHYIKIYADTNYNGVNYRHKGKYPASADSVYRLEVSPQLIPVVGVTTSKIIIDGICIKNILPDSSYGGNCIQLADCDQGGTIENCILVDDKTSIAGDLGSDEHGHGIRIDGVTKYSKYYIHNNIISGFNDVNDFAPGNCGILTYPVTDSIIAYVDNNTIYNCKFGIWNRGGESGYDSCRVILRNNIFQDPTGDIYSDPVYQLGVSQFPVMTDNVILPNSTPAGMVFDYGFEGTKVPFIYGDTSYASLAAYPAHSGAYSLYVATGYASISLNTNNITVSANTTYILNFCAAWSMGNAFTVTIKDGSGNTLGGATTPVTNSYTFTNETVQFTTGSSTSIIIYITSGTGGAYCFFDDFLLCKGNVIGGSCYFVNPAADDFHLLSTAALALNTALNLSGDANDAFTTDASGMLRPSSWDVGALQFGGSDTSGTSSIGSDTATSTACQNIDSLIAKTNALEAQGNVKFNNVEGFFTAYKVFSPNFFTYIQNQDYQLFTHIIQSAGNVYMNGACTIPAFDLPMEAIVTGTPCDSINVVSGAPLTGTSAIEMHSVAGGEAGVAQKIQTIMGQGCTGFYIRFQLYLPANFTAHKTSWTSGHYAFVPFLQVLDSAASGIFQFLLDQDTTNYNNIVLEVDTVVTSVPVSRGSVINIQVHYQYNAACRVWIGSSQSESSPAYTHSCAPAVKLNNELIIGLGWTRYGAGPVYINNVTIDSAFIPDNYITQPPSTYVWGNYDQSVTSTVTYGSNIPVIGIIDSCKAHNIEADLSIGGWPGQYTGLASAGSAGVTEWTSNTPWNYMMKDTTSSWLDQNGITQSSGLRGHWIYNLIKLFEKTGFTGADFDFEFIGMDTIGLASKYQAKLFPDFLQALRASFDTAGHSNWYISFCAPIPWGNTFPDTAYFTTPDAYGNYLWRGSGSPLVPADSILWGNWNDRWIDWNRIYSIVNEVHLMTYGFSGMWDSANTWNDALYRTPAGYDSNYWSMEKIDNIIVARGYPKSKTSIGFGFFGNVWLHNNDIFEPINGLYTNSAHTWATVITLGNSDLLYPNSSNTSLSFAQRWQSIKSMGANYGFCKTYNQPFYKYNIPGSPITFPQCGVDSLTGSNPASSANFIINYDDSLSTANRLKWVYNHGYKSIFIWEITQDFEPNSQGVLRPTLEDAMQANLSPYIPFVQPAWYKVYFAKNQHTYDTILTGRDLSSSSSSSSPTLIFPLGNYTTGMQPVFLWHSVPGASGYDLQAALDTNFTNPVINLLNYQDTIYHSLLNTFDTSSTYYWRVKAVNGSWARQSFSTFSNSNTLAAVQIGTISSTQSNNLYNIIVPWNVYYISNLSDKATECDLYLNGVYVGTDTGLTVRAGQQQSDTAKATVGWGNYSVTIVQYNSSGETQVTGHYSTAPSSTPMQMDTAGINILCNHPSIQIDSNGCEADVILIKDSTTYTFTFQTIGAYNPNYTVLIKDNSFFNYSTSGNVLTINASRGGLTGLGIKENQTGRTRYIGLAVKDWTGMVPKFPPYVMISNLTQYFPASLPFYKDIRNGNADDNKRMDGGWYYYYPAYLTNGILDVYIRNSLRFGIQSAFAWYNLSADNPVVDSSDMVNVPFLETYFTELMQLMNHCDSVMHGVPININIEPDFIGYMIKDYPTMVSLVSPCSTNAAISAGVLTGSDPAFPNNLKGFCEEMAYIIKKYYPSAAIGWAYPIWAAAHNTGTGEMHLASGIIAGDFGQLGETAVALGMNYLTDYISIEGWGYDGGYDIGEGSTAYTNPSGSSWFWNMQHWDNYLMAANILNQSTGLGIILNGNSGHIDSSLAQSPAYYHSNNKFPSLVDTTSAYEDSAPDFFFGDTMYVSSGNRLAWFSTIASGDTAGLSVNGNTVIWNQHITKAAQDGVIGISFGPGEGIDTHNTPDPNTNPVSVPSDQYWWMVKAQRYYKNPALRP